MIHTFELSLIIHSSWIRSCTDSISPNKKSTSRKRKKGKTDDVDDKADPGYDEWKRKLLESPAGNKKGEEYCSTSSDIKLLAISKSYQNETRNTPICLQ